MSLNQETISRLQALGIHSVLVQFCDIHGVAKGKLVPLANLQEWVEQGAGFAGPSIWGTGLPRFGARSEYYARVQLDSLQPLPFMPGVDWWGFEVLERGFEAVQNNCAVASYIILINNCGASLQVRLDESDAYS